MEAVQAYYDGRAFVPVYPVKIQKNRAAIITILDESPTQPTKNAWRKYAGRLSDADYQELAEILQDTKKVDANEW
jgi:hypothetical protein